MNIDEAVKMEEGYRAVLTREQRVNDLPDDCFVKILYWGDSGWVNAHDRSVKGCLIAPESSVDSWKRLDPFAVFAVPDKYVFRSERKKVPETVEFCEEEKRMIFSKRRCLGADLDELCENHNVMKNGMGYLSALQAMGYVVVSSGNKKV